MLAVKSWKGKNKKLSNVFSLGPCFCFGSGVSAKLSNDLMCCLSGVSAELFVLSGVSAEFFLWC